LIVVGVALTALATATAGPIAFVSLAAPQLARRLTRTAGVALLPAAAMGALLLAGADIIAQRAFAPTQLPVGVVTASIGGLYLVWLLAREARRQ
jgi:iron complex transport system permease protein